MPRNPFSKPNVSVEADEAIRGTDWRECSVRIETRIDDQRARQRIQSALEMLSIGSEAAALPGAPGATFTRFKLRYYGAAISPERVTSAVRHIL